VALPRFISDAELLAGVKAALGLQPADTLSGEFSQIVAAANATATDEIYCRLGRLGFTSDVIASFDEGKAYARDLGVFWALTRAAGLGGYSAPQLKTFDRREELDTRTILFVNGTAVAPASQVSAVGGISHGRSTAAGSAARHFRRLSGECW
jgi:hypothetical protein